MKVSDAELVECLRALEDAPNKAVAARSLGLPRKTFNGRIEQALARGLTADTETTTKADEIRQLKAKLKVEEEKNARLEHSLEVARAPAVEFPHIQTSKRKVRVRAVMPDVHGNHADKRAVGAFLSDLDQVRPDELIGLGDLAECGGWLAQKHTLGFVAEVEQMSYKEDMAACNSLLDRLQAIVPEIELLEGNHEERLERWCVTAALRHGPDAEFLRQMIAPEYVLNLEARGIPYHRRHKNHDGLTERGVIKRGRCFFTHGFSTAKHAAYQHILRAGGNIVYGHTHRADYMPNRTIANGLSAAWSPGCLSQLQPLWQHSNPTSWTHGYILQFIDPDGYFQTIQVPINNGQSFLSSVIHQLVK